MAFVDIAQQEHVFDEVPASCKPRMFLLDFLLIGCRKEHTDILKKNASESVTGGISKRIAPIYIAINKQLTTNRQYNVMLAITATFFRSCDHSLNNLPSYEYAWVEFLQFGFLV